MNILFTICGRAGSKGLKNKNLKLFHGYPLIMYTLSAIDLFKKTFKDTHLIDIALNTDSKELQNLVKDYPQILIVDRKETLASDVASKISVIKDTYIQSEKITGEKYDYIIDLDLTSPMRTVEDIQKLIKQKIEYPNYDVVFSVVNSRRNPFFNMVQKNDQYVTLVNNSNFTARQQTPKIYDMNASMYLYDALFLTNESRIFDGNCGVIVMNDYLILDIDSEEDFEWMSHLYPKILEENQGIKDIFRNITLLTV